MFAISMSDYVQRSGSLDLTSGRDVTFDKWSFVDVKLNVTSIPIVRPALSGFEVLQSRLSNENTRRLIRSFEEIASRELSLNARHASQI